MVEWHKADIADVALELGTDTKAGRMNMDSTRKRRRENNVISVPEVNPKSIIQRIASDASFVLLSISYIIAACLGHLNEALFALPLLVFVFISSCCIKYLSEKKISASHRMLLPQAKIIENGKRRHIDVSEVEVGDLIYFGKGDIIPSDARLVSSTDLIVAERFYNEISGKPEYRYFTKDCNAVYTDDLTAFSYANMVYASSFVSSGRGSAIVTAVGKDTKIAKLHKGVSLIPENDAPLFFKSFKRLTRILSLTVLFLTIFLSLFMIYLTTCGKLPGGENDLIYIFLILLATATASMSEPIASSAEIILTRALFKTKGKKESCVTNLSATEKIAEADTLLILCPEILKDTRKHVRRVWFSDTEYRFDKLKNKELGSFLNMLSGFYKYQRAAVDASDLNAIKKLLSFFENDIQSDLHPTKPRLIRNFPFEGARTCVYATEGDYPIEYFTQSSDPNIVSGCEYFRTEEGSKWKFDENTRNHINIRS